MGKNKASTVAKYRRKHYDRLDLFLKKDEYIIPLIDLASSLKKVSKNEYVKNAIQSQLDRDNVTVDMLLDADKHIPDLNQPQFKEYMIYMITSCYLATKAKTEEYVTVFPTLSMAKKYIAEKFKRKAHPEDWAFTIYGRYFEAKNKHEATEKYRQMASKAVEAEVDLIIDDSDEDESAVGWVSFLEELDKYRKPDYIEVVDSSILNHD